MGLRINPGINSDNNNNTIDFMRERYFSRSIKTQRDI